jgi:hypothetical protein
MVFLVCTSKGNMKTETFLFTEGKPKEISDKNIAKVLDKTGQPWL